MRVIRNHKYDFRPNLHATEFDYHLMHPSLNGKNLLDQIQDFLFYTNMLLTQYWASQYKFAKVVCHFFNQSVT